MQSEADRMFLRPSGVRQEAVMALHRAGMPTEKIEVASFANADRENLAVHCSNLLKSNMSPHWGFSWRDPSVTLAP